MLTDRELALAAEWLLPGGEVPCQWDEEGEAILWYRDKTVVFREELRILVERFADRGLPPAAPFLLLLAGCRGLTPQPNSDWEDYPMYPTFERLARLPALASKRFGETSGRAILAQQVFADVPPVPDEQTAAVLAFFRARLPIKALPKRHHTNQLCRLLPVYKTLAAPLQKLDPFILELLRVTGVAALPEAAEIELPEVPNTGRRFADLADDPEFSPIFRVARDVMAAVSIPEALVEQDEELLGGVSDIGNRGPLHRLLLSELAHDDDTLAIRIALNEALYLRREPTSQQPPGTLALLLDTGLRMWGTPRVFAVSTALAFLAKASKRARPTIFRTHENAVVPADLQTRDGLIAQLAALDPALHAGPSLPALARSLASLEGPLDLVIVTHSATAEDRDFLDALAHFPDAHIFLAALDREGQLAVRRRTAHGWRTLTEARIDLRGLGKPRPNPPKLRQSGALPAILALRPFPFLLSPFGHYTRRCALTGDRRAFLTDSGEVWIFRDAHRGARRLLTAAVAGTVLFFGPDQTEERLAVVAWRSKEQILEMRSEHADGETMTFAQRHDVRACPLRMQLRGGILFLVFKEHAEAVLVATGALLGSVKLTPGMRAIGGRYVLVPKAENLWNVAALAWNGTALELQAFPCHPEWNRGFALQLALVFDRKGRETPWALHRGGWLFSLDGPIGTKLRVPFDGTVREAEASHGGDRIRVRETRNKRQMTDLAENDEIQPCMDLAFNEQMIENVPDPAQCSMRIHFTHICMDVTGRVMLRAEKDYWTEIGFSPARDGFRFVRAREGPPKSMGDRNEAFRPLATPSALHVSLKVAEWRDGSRAFLDSRGLLHFQSADPAVPEVTLVLADGTSLPAWSSDGHILGLPYFLGARASTDKAGARIEAHLRSFGQHLP